MENLRFKFRAWYTSLSDLEEKPHYVYDIEQLYDGFTNKGASELGWVSSFGSLLDSPEEYIIEQCTGLKDKNGKLIYENDLIKCPNGIYRIAVDDFGLWTAIYENNPLKDVVEWSDIVKEYAFNQDNVELEVIGNIHTENINDM